MQLEIEIKARVADPAALTARIAAAGGRLVRRFRKDDRYWRLPLPPASVDQALATRPWQDVRLRLDDGECFLTYKDKRLDGGLEINDEHETPVGDPATLERLFARLGGTPLVRKLKEGEAWELDGLLLELSDVSGLGWFIEIEFTGDAPDEPGAREAAEQAAAARVHGTLAALGLPESAVESRSYTSLLLAAAGR